MCQVKLDNLLRLCQLHGFMYPIECLVNTTALTCYNYGPLGSLLRRNLMREWWSAVVTKQHDIFAVDISPVISGSEGNNEGLSICEHQNGVAKDHNHTCFLRHSASQGMLNHYLPSLSLVGMKLPFGLAHEGRCIRRPLPANQGSTDSHSLLRSDDYHEMVLQYFVPPKTVIQWIDHWQRQRLTWWKMFSGNPSNLSVTDNKQNPNGNQEIHIQYAFSWGKETIETIVNHTEEPLLKMQNDTGISHQGKYGRKMMLPQMIECKATLEKGLMVYLLDGYKEQEGPKNSKKDTKNKQLLHLHPRLAPYKVAITTSGTKAGTEVREVANFVSKELRDAGIMVLDLYDTSSTLDSQYTKYDEMGVPLTVNLNDNTLKTGIALLRNRDTTLKEKVSITNLKHKVRQVIYTY